MSRVVAHGPAVLTTATRILPLMTEIPGMTDPTLGRAPPIARGTIDKRQGWVILGQAGGEVYYIHGSTLIAEARVPFLRAYMIGGLISDVYRRTQWIIPAYKIAMAFCMGVAIGAISAVGVGALLFAAGAQIAVTVTRVVVFLNAHPSEVGIVRQHLPPFVDALRWFRDNCPVLYSKLTAVLERGLLEALLNSPSGITAEDAASVLGRLLGGAVGAGDTGLLLLMRILATTLGAYTVLHLPSWTAHAAAQHAPAIARAMVEEFRRQRVSVTPQEEQQIGRELSRTVEALRRLQSMEQALNALNPALQRLANEWRAQQ